MNSALLLLLTIFSIHLNASAVQKPSLAEKIRNACTLLNVAAGDSSEQITKKYRILSKTTHPDRSDENDKKDAEKAFKELNNAHALLKENIDMIADALKPKNFNWRDFCTHTAKRARPTNTPQSWETIYNACLVLQITPSDSIEEMRAKHTNLTAKYVDIESLNQHDQIVLAMYNRAYKVLSEEYAIRSEENSTIDRVFTFLKAGFKRPVEHTFSRETINAAIQIIQKEHCVVEPSLHYMRCYRWRQLVDAIKIHDIEEVTGLLAPNPYLCNIDHSYEQNPELQKIATVAELTLKAAHLTAYDLVNITDGRTTALKEAEFAMHNLIPVKQAKKRALAIYNLVVAHGKN